MQPILLQTNLDRLKLRPTNRAESKSVLDRGLIMANVSLLSCLSSLHGIPDLAQQTDPEHKFPKRLFGKKVVVWKSFQLAQFMFSSL